MIQFNLLPDVKLAFVKARRSQRFAITVSVFASIISATVLIVLLLVVDGLQKAQLNNLNNEIASNTTQISNNPNLNKILTVQNQIQALPTLYAQKPAVSRLFTYIEQLTPNTVSLNAINIAFTQNIWDLSGTAPDLATVDKFVDTLKFTTYTIGNSTQNANAFSNVVLYNFGIAAPPQNNVSFTINTSFAPAIFKATNNITLNVPNIISTRSETQQPQNLFAKPVAFIKLNNTNLKK